MNKLDFRVIKHKEEKFSLGISFELIIDGIEIGKLLKTEENQISHWYFEKADLESYYNEFADKTDYVIGVCSCGESGCGMLGCEISKNDAVVVMKNMFNDGKKYGDKLKFRFSRENYDDVMQRIFVIASEFKSGQEKGEKKK